MLENGRVEHHVNPCCMWRNNEGCYRLTTMTYTHRKQWAWHSFLCTDKGSDKDIVPDTASVRGRAFRLVKSLKYIRSKHLSSFLSHSHSEQPYFVWVPLLELLGRVHVCIARTVFLFASRERALKVKNLLRSHSCSWEFLSVRQHLFQWVK